MTDDEQFLAEFEACKLPLERWHHKDHIKVAYLYLRKYPFGEAMSRIRERIKAHNAAHNIPEAIDRGYHETMTQAWMRLRRVTVQHNAWALARLSFPALLISDTFPPVTQSDRISQCEWGCGVLLASPMLFPRKLRTMNT